jgi:hypothetical protein
MELVPKDGVRVASITSAVSLDPKLDLRRRRPGFIIRRMRFAVVFEPLDPSESELELEELSSEEDSIHAATGPGTDSSSMMC